MGEIREFAEEHIPEVADLHMKVMRGRRERASEATRNYFREIFFTNPWVSPEFPSLVYLEGGGIVGFMGVIPRTMEFKGSPIRVAVGTQFVVDRERHRGSGAIALLRRLFSGPQDICYTDGAGEANHVVWTATGGLAAQLYSFNWLRTFRPVATTKSFANRSEGLARTAAAVGLTVASPLDFLVSKISGSPFRPQPSAFTSRQVSVDELFNTIQSIGWREPLKPAYELSSFRWLMDQFAAREGSTLRMAVTETAKDELAGWYAYVRKENAVEVLQIGVRRRDLFDGVLRTLFADAFAQGAAFVKGQAMPPFLVNLTNHGCLFRQANTCVLFHTRNHDLADVILRGQAALSQLDGEGWLRFTTIK